MQKVSRKHAQDPIQEKLREHKSDWNPEVSRFIGNLINFKKMLNGKPSTFHQQKTKITEPIPMNPDQIIDALYSDFSSIYQDAKSIVREQEDYSKSKNQPSVAYHSFDLTKESSSKFTRFLSKLKPPFLPFSDSYKNKKKRLAMLDFFTDIDKQLFSVQEKILKSSKESFFEGMKIFQDSFDRLSSMKSQFQIVEDIQDDVKQKFDELRSDIQYVKFLKKLDKSVFISMAELAKLSLSSSDQNEKNKLFLKLKELYNKNLEEAKKLYDMQSAKNFLDIYTNFNENKKEAPQEEQIVTPDKKEVKKEQEQPATPVVTDVIVNEPGKKEDKKEDSVDNLDPVIIEANNKKTDFLSCAEGIPNLNKQQIQIMRRMFLSYAKLKNDNEDKIDDAIVCIKNYEVLLEKANQANNTKASSFHELLTIKKASYENMYKTAKFSLQKWLNEMKHKYLSGDSLSEYVLKINEAIESLRKSVDGLMDYLEKDYEPNSLNIKLNDLIQEFVDCYDIMKPLHYHYGGRDLSKEFINLLTGDKLNISRELSSKDKESLEKKLKDKSMRFLSRIHDR